MENPPESGTPPPENKPQDLRISLQEVNGNYSKYEVTANEEVLVMLRGLQKNGASITAYLNDGQDFLLTSLLAVDDANGKLLLALDRNRALNRRAQFCSKLVCLSAQGKIKMQFVLDGVSLVRFGEGNAFQGNLPVSLIRLQRRDYYRLTVPKGKPLICTIPVPQADGSLREYEANILNISGRGLTLTVPPEDIDFAIDQEFPACRIELPSGDKIVTTLQIRSIYLSNLSGGRTSKRAGCQFLKLPSQMQKLLLHYILKVESERLAAKL